jgi:hypothetical protein
MAAIFESHCVRWVIMGNCQKMVVRLPSVGGRNAGRALNKAFVRNQ